MQEWVLELLLICEDSKNLSILLELSYTVGAPGSYKVVLVLSADPGQNLVHGLGSHKREPGVDAVLGEFVRESAMEETAEHGTESRVLRRPRAIF